MRTREGTRHVRTIADRKVLFVETVATRGRFNGGRRRKFEATTTTLVRFCHMTEIVGYGWTLEECEAAARRKLEAPAPSF